jgi:hypothetical protein
MSYLAQWNLDHDFGFNSRCRACMTEQALVFGASAEPPNKALSQAVIRNDQTITASFVTLVAGSPGLAQAADPDDDGTVDAALIPDAMLLSTVQGQWPIVASVFFNEDGTPIE